MNQLVIGVASIAATLATTLIGEEVIVPALAKRYNLYGIDVHKPWRPKVAEVGGAALLLGVLASTTISLLIDHVKALAVMLLALWLWGIGFIDDRFKLSPLVKPILTLGAAVPIIVLGAYYPYPSLPFIGKTRLTIIYPALLAIGVMVSSNMFNMIDSFNGMMASVALIIASTSIVAAIIKLVIGQPIDYTALVILSSVAAALAIHLAYNWYPARVFNGDAGSLMIGGLLLVLDALLGLEVFFIAATLPLILNGFSIITSIGGLKERREMPRPTTLTDDGLIRDSGDPRAPITLVRMIVAEKPLSEEELVIATALLVLVSSLLALITVPLSVG